MTIKTHGRMFTDNSVGITQLNVNDGTDSQALVTDGSGTLRFATVGAGGSVGSSVYVEDTRTGNGVLTTFSLSTAVPYEESIFVFIDGIAQPTTAYTLPTTTSITFSSAPITGTTIRICHLGIASSIADNGITGAKIAMGADAAGDVLYYNGTDYQRLGIGTASQHLATNSGANAPEWVTSPSSGQVRQIKSTRSGAYSTAAAIPGLNPDDTIPQWAEVRHRSDFDVPFTPTSASSRLLIFGTVMVNTTNPGSLIYFTLHQDSGAAIAIHDVSIDAHYAHISLQHDMASPGTSAVTFQLGVTGESGTVYVNGDGQAQGRSFGGVAGSCLTVIEYTP